MWVIKDMETNQLSITNEFVYTQNEIVSVIRIKKILAL